jgi:WD40-like Beta Propeller Repeat
MRREIVRAGRRGPHNGWKDGRDIDPRGLTVRFRRAVHALSVGALVALVASGCSYVTRASVGSTGVQQNSIGPGSVAVSGDGRFVAFTSDATNLVSGDTNGQTDVFVRDTLNGATERVSVSTSGAQGNQASGALDGSTPAISRDGRWVAFISDATNLVSGDTNDRTDVFVRDRSSGVTQIVSLGAVGAQGDHNSRAPAISDDGRYVAFRSDSTTFVPGDTNGLVDVFVRDRQSGTTGRVSVSSGNAQANGHSSLNDAPVMSGDARYVAFSSVASNLVTGDTNLVSDVFVRDRTLATTTRASVSSINNAQANEGSDQPSISADGRYLAFSSFASNLIGSFDSSTNRDIFLRENATSNTVGFTFDANGDSSHPSIGLNSGLPVIAYESTATNLVQNDTNGVTDVFVQDYFPFTLRTRVSTDQGGAQSSGGTSYGAALSSDGRYAGFRSQATNLVTGDTNGGDDVFLHFAHPPVVGNSPNPTSLPRGAVHQSVQIFGGNLENPATVNLGDGVTVNSVTYNSPVLLILDVSVAPAAAVGARNIDVFTLGSGPGVTAGGRGICAGCFAVT